MPEKKIKSNDPIICEKKGGVSWVIMNRPEFLNAVTTEMGNAALEAIDSSLEDDDTRVVVITGRGKALSAGADVTEIVGDPDPIKRIGILATIAHNPPRLPELGKRDRNIV